MPLHGADAPAEGGRCRRCGKPWPATAAHCFGCGCLQVSAACSVHRSRVAASACLVCGATLCRACRHGFSYGPLCAAHAHVHVMQGWAEVARARDEVRAQLMVDRLRSHGLDSIALSQKDRWHVVTFGALAIVRILVPAGDFEEAHDVLGSLPDSRVAG